MMTKAQKQDLTQGVLWKQILFFSLPLILSNLLQVLFNLADVAVVGRFVGSLALGAVGSSSILVYIFTGFLIGIGGGINVLTAQAFGAGNKTQLERTVHSAALLSLLIGVVLTVLGVTFAEDALLLMGTKPDLIAGAVLYIRIYLLGLPAMALYNFGSAVFSAVGDTQRPLRYLTTAGILNVLLNLFFVTVLHLDVAGVALASILSQYLSAFLVVGALFRLKGDYTLKLRSLRMSKKPTLDILKIGLPGGFQSSLFALSNILIQAGINTFDTVMVSGNAAAANADSLVYETMTAFYTACSSFMGQNYGAKQRKRMLRSYFISLLYSFGAGTAIGLLLFFFGEAFLGLFTREAAVIDAGMQRLAIMGVTYGFSAFMDCTIYANRAMGKSLIPSIIVITGVCGFRILWLQTVFAYFGTIPSLYLLYIFSWVLTATAEILYFIHTYRSVRTQF